MFWASEQVWCRVKVLIFPSCAPVSSLPIKCVRPRNPRLEHRAGFARWRFGLRCSVRVTQGFSSPPDFSRRCDLQLKIFYHPRRSQSPCALLALVLLARIKASFLFPVDPSAAECLGPREQHVLLPEKRFCCFGHCFDSPPLFYSYRIKRSGFHNFNHSQTIASQTRL
jgi:hypothetical protein